MQISKREFLKRLGLGGVGTAAALCAKKDISPRALDSPSLAKALRSQGVFLG